MDMNLEDKLSGYRSLCDLRESIGEQEVSLEGTISRYNSLAGKLGEKSYSLNRRAKKTDIDAMREDIVKLCRRPQSMAEIVDGLSALHNELTIQAQVRHLVAQKRLYKTGTRGRGVTYMVRSALTTAA